MKIGDRVRIIRGHYSNGEPYTASNEEKGTIVERSSDDKFDWTVRHDNVSLRTTVFSEDELELIPPDKTDTIRTFGTGATRDTSAGKLSYVKALCPIVLQRYVQYLDKHRLQPDGSMREFDNWKKGIPRETYQDSRMRHEITAWLLSQGIPAEDNHGPVNIEDTLCAIIFNAMGELHEVLKEKQNANS